MYGCPNSACFIRTSFIALNEVLKSSTSHPVFEREIVLQNSIILSNAVIKDWTEKMLKRLQNSCTLLLIMNETTRSLNDDCGPGASMPTGRE